MFFHASIKLGSEKISNTLLELMELLLFILKILFIDGIKSLSELVTLYHKRDTCKALKFMKFCNHAIYGATCNEKNNCVECIYIFFPFVDCVRFGK